MGVFLIGVNRFRGFETLWGGLLVRVWGEQQAINRGRDKKDSNVRA